MPNISQEDRDKNSPVWDMSQERNLALTLLNQRFSFLLVLFGICVAGAVNAKSQAAVVAILAVGVLVAGCQTYVIYLSQVRLDHILDIIEQDPTHPFTVVMGRFGRRRISRWVGFYIPLACCAVLVTGLVIAVAGWATHPAPTP